MIPLQDCIAFSGLSEDEVTVTRLEQLLTSFTKDEFGNDNVRLVGWIIEKEPNCFGWDSSITAQSRA